MQQRSLEEAAGHRRGILLEILDGAGAHHLAAAHARAGAEIDDVIGAPDGVFVVLDHDQRIAVFGQLGQRIEQHAVVARMQADGGFVEHVAHTLQIGAELRREPDALRLAARQRGRRAVQRQIAQADALQEGHARLDLGHEVARDLGLALGQAQLVHERHGVVDGLAP